MGGGPARATDYSRGHSALRIADSHRHEVDSTHAYWRKDVEAEVIRAVADRHDADVLYHAGDEGGAAEMEYVRDLGFDLVRFTPGNHDTVAPEDVESDGTILAGEVLEWEVSVDRDYTVAMAHDPRTFDIRLETQRSTADSLFDDAGEPYDLVITAHGHFSRQHMINPWTAVDHAGALKKNYTADGLEPERSFVVRRFWDEFPRDLQEEVSPPERSLAVHRFWNGITTYRYDAEELAEAYVAEDRAIGDVEPESVAYFDPGRDEADAAALLDGERPVAMTD